MRSRFWSCSGTYNMTSKLYSALSAGKRQASRVFTLLPGQPWPTWQTRSAHAILYLVALCFISIILDMCAPAGVVRGKGTKRRKKCDKRKRKPK